MIEIVHLDRDRLIEFSKLQGNIGKIAQEILGRQESGQDITFLQGDLTQNIPDIDVHTQIVIGGGIGEVCVKQREQVLVGHGFTNVHIDPSLTLTDRIIHEDETNLETDFLNNLDNWPKLGNA